jgi:hypothetical protein
LYFIYSGNKQSTEKEINTFDRNKVTELHIKSIESINKVLIEAERIEDFMEAIDIHEDILSGLLSRPVLKSTYTDFSGSVKSLGAWGGDFFLAVSPESTDYVEAYFKEKGHETMFSYSGMVLSKTVKQYV